MSFREFLGKEFSYEDLAEFIQLHFDNFIDGEVLKYARRQIFAYIGESHIIITAVCAHSSVRISKNPTDTGDLSIYLHMPIAPHLMKNHVEITTKLYEIDASEIVDTLGLYY